jgi:hypothetical protein
MNNQVNEVFRPFLNSICRVHGVQPVTPPEYDEEEDQEEDQEEPVSDDLNPQEEY